MVVNDAFVKKFIPNGLDPMAQRIDDADKQEKWTRIVGVVGNVRQSIYEPPRPERDLLWFIASYAPEMEDWERDIFLAVREESFYFYPVYATQIMNEGWASYWHSKMMTEKVLNASEIIDYADNNAGVMATSPGRFNPYKVGVELYRYIEDRWNKGRFGREWEECTDLDAKKNWNLP